MSELIPASKETTEWDKETLSGKPPEMPMNSGAPAPIDPETGMNKDYWVLPEAERAKGFVRPVRRTYIHIGCRPKYPTRELTAEEHERYDKYGYVVFEAYPENDDSSGIGRYWTQAQLNSGCQTSTKMAQAIAETYARNPSYYGATFCAHCGAHFPVGKDGEFVWEDGTKVGS